MKNTTTCRNFMWVSMLLMYYFMNQSVYASDFECFPPDSLKKKPQKAFRVVPLPVVYYSPETRWAFGALGQFLFKINQQDTVSRTSTLQLALIYTLNKQYLISSDYNIFFDQEKYWWKGSFTYKKFPEFYYGAGNQTKLSDKEGFSYFSINWEGRFVRKIKKGLFVGLTHRFEKVYDVNVDDAPMLKTNRLLGATGYRISGLGPVLVRDKRNSVINASEGYFLELSARIFHKTFGSQFNYQLYKIDARKYFPLSKDKRHVLAFQALGEFRNGDIPIHRYSRMGDAYTMRGHYNGRYRDKQYWATQSEYRFPIYKFLGGVGFMGIGNVCQSCMQDPFKSLKYSLGGGLRFMIDKTERLNIRLDYAFVRDDSNFYIQITEAF